MDEEPLYVEAYGFRFNVTYNGFDDHMGDLGEAVNLLCSRLDGMGRDKVKQLWTDGLYADLDPDGMGSTAPIRELEAAAFKAATQNWEAKHDAYIWLTAVRNPR